MALERETIEKGSRLDISWGGLGAESQARVVLSAMLFPGVSVAGTTRKEHGATSTQPERPVQRAAVLALWTPLIAGAGASESALPAGDDIRIEARLQGRVSRTIATTWAAARGDAGLRALIDAARTLLAEVEPLAAAEVDGRWQEP